MRQAILEFLQDPSCKMDVTLFVETAYWWKFDKNIPQGALREVLVQLKSSEEDPLPVFLVEFYLNVRAGWKLIHQQRCRPILSAR